LSARSSSKRPGAYPAYLILEGGFAFAFSLIVTVNLVWQAEVAGLSPLQLVLVGTLLELTCLLGEIPTGVVADLYSRRLSILLGLCLIGAGFMLEGFVPTFQAILMAQVIWGLGATFMSGAKQAWISDEIGEPAASRAFLRAAQVTQLAALAAIPFSIALASVQLNLAIIVGAACFFVLTATLALVMPELGFVRHAPMAPGPGRDTLASMADQLKDGLRLVRSSRLLVWLLVLAAFFGMASEGLDRLSIPHILRDFELPPLLGLDPVAWFGVLRTGAILLSIGVTEVVRRRLDLHNTVAITRVLFVADTLRIASLLVFAFAGNFFVAMAASWTGAVCRRLSEPIHLAWLNQQLESRTRATVLSMSGQMDALGQIAGGPVVGLIGNASLRAAIASTGLALLPALVVYARTTRSRGAVGSSSRVSA